MNVLHQVIKSFFSYLIKLRLLRNQIYVDMILQQALAQHHYFKKNVQFHENGWFWAF